MNSRSVIRSALVAVTLVALTLVGTVARAQIDPFDQSYGIYQNDRLVGEVYRVDVDTGSYTEHWILYPGYVYPTDTTTFATLIRPSGLAYRGLADFFARVSWGSGSRYVQAACIDRNTLPAAR